MVNCKNMNVITIMNRDLATEMLDKLSSITEKIEIMIRIFKKNRIFDSVVMQHFKTPRSRFKILKKKKQIITIT